MSECCVLVLSSDDALADDEDEQRLSSDAKFSKHVRSRFRSTARGHLSSLVNIYLFLFFTGRSNLVEVDLMCT